MLVEEEDSESMHEESYTSGHTLAALPRQPFTPSASLPQQPVNQASAANVVLSAELSPAVMRRPRVLIIDLGSAFFLEGDEHFAQEEMNHLDRLLRAAL